VNYTQKQDFTVNLSIMDTLDDAQSSLIWLALPGAFVVVALFYICHPAVSRCIWPMHITQKSTVCIVSLMFLQFQH